MSGFIAIVNRDCAPIDRDLMAQLTDSLRYRGPDLQKNWINTHVGLAHALFRTTDEAEYEHQPASLDGDIWITGSARIDARSDLVNSLGLQSEIRLDQTPDSHLILYAYKAWGEHCVDHLLGDFAFALWDKKTKKLFCARDRFGVRQLYYSLRKGALIVGNSLSCMRKHPLISNQVEDRAIGGFLLFGDHSWLDKELTTSSDISSLLPAHKLVFSAGKFKTSQYWTVPENLPLLRYRKESEYLDHFQDTFTNAIRDRIRTDRVVLSMSGGMDSSSIGATLKEIQDRADHGFELNAVSIVFNKIHPCQERYFADLIASHLELPIQYIDGDNYPFLSKPLATTRPLEIEQPSLWLDTMRAQRLLGRVVLTGGAGDNLFKYPMCLASIKENNPAKLLFYIFSLQKRYGKRPGIGTGLWNKLRHLFSKGGNISATPYPYPTWLNSDFERRMQLDEWWHKFWALERQSSAFSARNLLLFNSLVKPDWSVDDTLLRSDFTLPEQRDPYLDLRMVEFVLSLPAIPWLFEKHILRQAMGKKLPVSVIKRPKTLLGTLHHSMLKLPNTQWIDQWQAQPEILQYIERSRIPKLAGGCCDPMNSYVDLRPLHLNRWLQARSE